MSAPIQRQTPASNAGNAARAGPRRWRAWMVGATLGTIALGASALPVWRRHALVTHVQANLPAAPEARSLPEKLAERVARAELQARNASTAIDGVAELGRLYHASGYPREAEACWELLRTAEPREARWCYYLADLRRTASDHASMSELLTRTTQLAPDYAPAWLRLADLQLKSGQLADAERSYRTRLTLVPDDRYANLGLVRVAMQQGRNAEAKDLVARLVKTAPDFSPGHNLYAQMLSAQGQADAAAHHRWLGRETGRFREADDPWLEELMAWCFNYEQLCIRGAMDFQTKHGDRGKAYFERAIELQPEKLTGYTLLGSLYLESNEPARARDIFEHGLKVARGESPSALFFVHLSRAYRDLKQPAEAVRIARHGLARVGDHYELHDALGVALGDVGESAAAVEALRTAVALNPSDTNANYNLAVALIAEHRLDEAVDALHRSLDLRPTFPASLALLAQIEIDSGRWETAVKYVRPLYESHPEMPKARQLMAYWHLRSGTEAENKADRVAAEQHYRAGVAIDPNHAELQSRLGTLYLVASRFSDAVEPLAAYHRLQPDNPQGCLFLGQAYAAVGRREEARRVLTKGAEIAERAGNITTARYCREILQHLQ